MRILKTSIVLGCLLLLLGSCSVKWTEAIRRGEVKQDQYYETVPVEITHGLLFVPVKIDGSIYRFLFDSGAPLSISEELQKKHSFKIISQGTIIDSDHNRTKVSWAQVHTVSIGTVSFLNQTAFVGDFEANPFLKCLEIDGIIGSNLLRQCNWTLDPEQQSLSLFRGIDSDTSESDAVLAFKTDMQFNMFIDLQIGHSHLKNVLVDYGSNGSVALSPQIFKTLKDANSFGETYTEKGIQQSGLVGKAIPLHRDFSFTDSLTLDKLTTENVILRTGPTVSVGTQLLNRFRTTIDWSEKKLYFKKIETQAQSRTYPDFRLGFTPVKGVYVQSVVEHSNAYANGLRPNMKVQQLDSLHFNKGNDFCDYAKYQSKDTISMRITDLEGHSQTLRFRKTHYEK